MIDLIALWLGRFLILGFLGFLTCLFWYEGLCYLYKAMRDTYYMSIALRTMRIAKLRKERRKWRKA